MKGLEPPRLSAQDPKSCVSAISPHPHKSLTKVLYNNFLFLAITFINFYKIIIFVTFYIFNLRPNANY